MKHRHALCCNKYCLKDRLRLFDAVITQLVLHSAGAWTVTLARQNLLRSTQRIMLRRMLGSGRMVVEASSSSDGSGSDMPEDVSRNEGAGTLEPWTEWISRTTHAAEDAARLSGVRDWVEEQSRRKWIWAGHVARRSDFRWSSTILDGKPSTSSRRQGRPQLRWEDALGDFFQQRFWFGRGVWKYIAQDRQNWEQLAEDFISYDIGK